MTEAQLRNVGMYILIALGGAVMATGIQLGVMLSGTDPIPWRPLAATFVTTLFGTLATAAGSAFRPRTGHEEVAALVSQVGPGPATAALEVEAVKQETGIRATPLTAEQRRMIVDDLEERMKTTPADDDDPPSGAERTAGQQTVDIVSRAVAATPPLPPEPPP